MTIHLERKLKHRSTQHGILFVSTIVFVMTSILLLCGCANQHSTSLEEPLALFYENKLKQALPLLKQVVAQQNDNAEAHAWLAETCRRLNMKDEALKTAYRALELSPCNSFAHTVIADACHRLPWDKEWLDSDTTWIHINKAIQCDSTDGNAWVCICGEAMLRGKFDLMHRSARKMKESGFLIKVALAFGRWLLRTLPENAILITNGDMDTFPTLAVQATEDFRTDVAIVEKEWLGLKQYLRYLRDRRGVHLPVQDSQFDSLTALVDSREKMLLVSDRIFKGWVAQRRSGSAARPIAVAITVYEDFYSDVRDQFQYAGPFMVWQPTPKEGMPDTAALEASLAGIRPEDFAGPWVSEQDRSPVRRVYTKYMVKNVTKSAIVLSEAFIRAKEFKEAERFLSWAEEFERLTELGPVYTEEISQLKEAAKVRKH